MYTEFWKWKLWESGVLDDCKYSGKVIRWLILQLWGYAYDKHGNTSAFVAQGKWIVSVSCTGNSPCARNSRLESYQAEFRLYLCVFVSVLQTFAGPFLEIERCFLPVLFCLPFMITFYIREGKELYSSEECLWISYVFYLLPYILKQFSLLCFTFKDITYIFSLYLKINLGKVCNLEMICCWLCGFNDRVTELR